MRKLIVALCTLIFVSGCATMNFDSRRPALEVSVCIAAGWRNSASSGYKLPVSVTKTEPFYFVGVELHPMFPSLVITGTQHPFYAVWAEVRDTSEGSATKYHRAYQFSHRRIDRVVIECQTVSE